MTSENIQLLLADDDEDDSMLFHEALEELSVLAELTVVHNGKVLMDLLSKKGNYIPTALFLDLNMPLKNGFECLSEIKTDIRLSNLPVIIISTSYDAEVVSMLYDNGAYLFIRKPAEFTKLKKVIRETLEILENGNERPAKEKFVLHA